MRLPSVDEAHPRRRHQGQRATHGARCHCARCPPGHRRRHAVAAAVLPRRTCSSAGGNQTRVISLNGTAPSAADVRYYKKSRRTSAAAPDVGGASSSAALPRRRRPFATARRSALDQTRDAARAPQGKLHLVAGAAGIHVHTPAVIRAVRSRCAAARLTLVGAATVAGGVLAMATLPAADELEDQLLGQSASTIATAIETVRPALASPAGQPKGGADVISAEAAPAPRRRREDSPQLGYAQELFREMGGFSNFAISFTIISILAGCLTSYFIALQQRRPRRDHLGLADRRRLLHLVALGDGRDRLGVCRPPAALYYWSSKLGSPAWGWFTGWFNLVGQIARHGGDRLRRGDLLGRRC